MRPQTFKEYSDCITPATFIHEPLRGSEALIKALILEDELHEAGKLMVQYIMESWKESYDIYATDFLESQGPL